MCHLNTNLWKIFLRNILKDYFLFSSRLDTGLVLTSLLTWASGESETKGKGEKKSWSNLMI
jgi:hypothetical protein